MPYVNAGDYWPPMYPYIYWDTRSGVFDSPSRTPYICPVCGGTGTVAPGFYSGVDETSSNSTARETCKACGGLGIVWG